MKKTLLTILSALVSLTALYAQNEIDALRYSRLNPSGTARFVSMGGAFSALGADFSTLSYNPAGIALYKKSELTITPSIYVGRTEATYFNRLNDDERYNFNLGNAGIIMVTTPSNTTSGWKNIQFGIGINRLANYNNRVLISGFNESSSYLTPYVINSQGVALNDLDNFGSGLAYDTDLMYQNSQGEYVNDMYGGDVLQRKTIETGGAMNEVVLSFGGNYNDRIYLGATVGIPSIKYRETSIYSEKDSEDNNDYFRAFNRIDNLETTGTGINLKVGMIIRATDWFRIGGAIQTPTIYSEMADSYTTTFESFFDTAQSLTASSEGFFEYELNTPFRATAGAAFLFGKTGLLSADYEYMDFASARLRSVEYDFNAENDAIKQGYNKAHNLRFGTEWRYGLISFRGGYAISANPYKEGVNSVMSTYSAGIGVRGNKFFADFAWALSNMDDEYHLYETVPGADRPVALTTSNNTNFLFTLGLKF